MGRTAGMSIKYLIISIFSLNIIHQTRRKKLTNLWNVAILAFMKYLNNSLFFLNEP